MAVVPIKAVFFDFGGVFTHSPFSAVEAMAQELGVNVMQFAEIIFGPYHDDTDHPWHQLERGEISFEVARQGIIDIGNAQDIRSDPVDLFMRMAGEKLVHEPVVQLLREVKQRGYATGIITNNLKEFREGWQQLIPVAECVDLVVDSSEVGIRKPNAAIYQHALTHLGAQQSSGILLPAEAVFLDDVIANVNAARELGMHGIHVTENPQNTVDALQALLKQYA